MSKTESSCFLHVWIRAGSVIKGNVEWSYLLLSCHQRKKVCCWSEIYQDCNISFNKRHVTVQKFISISNPVLKSWYNLSGSLFLHLSNWFTISLLVTFNLVHTHTFDIYFQIDMADTELSVGKSSCLSGDVTGVILGAICEVKLWVNVSGQG